MASLEKEKRERDNHLGDFLSLFFQITVVRSFFFVLASRFGQICIRSRVIFLSVEVFIQSLSFFLLLPSHKVMNVIDREKRKKR